MPTTAVYRRNELVRRGWLLLKTFPEVVPDTTFQESFLGKRPQELSHVENLPQRVPIVLTAGLIAAAAIGLGDMVLRGLKLERPVWVSRNESRSIMAWAPDCSGVLTLAGRAAWDGSIRGCSAVGLGLLAPSWALGDLPAVWRGGPIQAELIACLARGSRDRPVRGGHDPGLDAAFHRLRRPRISPARAQGVLPGRCGSPSCPTTFTRACRSASRCFTWLGMEVMGDWWWGGLAGQLLVAFFAPAAAVLIAADGATGRLGTSRLVRGDRLPFDSVDLSSGGDRLRRRSALLLSRGPGVGVSSAASAIARSRAGRIWSLIGPPGRAAPWAASIRP